MTATRTATLSVWLGLLVCSAWRAGGGEAAADIQAKLNALEAAHQAGVLSAEEYARKKAELEAQLRPAAPQLDDATRQKLQALEAAHKAGVLTAEEFARKKAELLQGTAPQLDEATQQKVKALEAARQAGVLSDAEFERKKTELLGGTPQPAAQPAAVPVTRKQGKLYRHPIGFSFWHPETWSVKEQDDFLQLTPPNPGTKDGAPTELYFIIGDSVAEAGIARSDDPRVAEYLDGQLKRLSPALQRVGAAAPVALARGTGTVLDWEARGADGQAVRARAFATILRDHGVALVGLGLKERLDARDADLRQMFASFGLGEGERDPALVGSWNLLSTTALSNESPFETSWSKARMVSDRQSLLVLRADGTWTRTDTRHMIAGAGGTWIEDKSQNVTKGRWNAGNGALYLIGDDNTWDDYKYQLRQTPQGRQLQLASGGTGFLWSETR